jgi:two-component system sensor histidine kinase MtrB
MTLGLRARGAIAFALLALLVSVVLAVSTYQIARAYLVQQRDALVVRQAGLNARAVNAGLDSVEPDTTTLLASLPNTGDSYGVVRLDDQWISGSLPADGDDIPSELVEAAMRGEAVKQRVSIDGVPTMIVGVPLTRASGAYFEVEPLRELDRTLSVIRWSLVAAAAAATILGALVGLYASRRVLRPLREFTGAADKVRRGRFDTRLAVEKDPDLAPIGDAFNEMAASLQHRTERDARFASDVSHELRNPLTALTAAVDVLEKRVDDRTRPVVQVLRAQVDRFSRLVLDLLELSRLDSEPAQVEVQRVSPAAFFPALLTDLGVPTSAIENGEVLPASLYVDKRRVERVLANLVHNAELHGGGVVRVRISPAGSGVQVAVDDCGPGIPLSERDAIFDRFHRGAQQSSESQGTGLGLAIAVEHCRTLGGSLSVETSPCGGARFIALIPTGAPA